MIVLFWTLMLGFMCGALAKMMTPGLKQGDVFVAMTIGLIGSVLFSWLGSVLKLYEFGGYYGLIASFIGACSLLFAYHEYIVRYKLPRTPERPENGQSE